MKIRKRLRITLVGALCGGLLATTMTAMVAPAQAASGSNPTGSLDHATVVDNGIRVRGWAWDADSTNSVSVNVKVGSCTKTVTANGTRADVAKAFPEAGDKRGFDVVVPIGPGTHTVSATAVNIGPGANKTFPAKTVTVSAPTGNLDHANVVDNGIRVRGWAWDADSTNSVSVNVKVGSNTKTVTANGTRADVAKAFPEAGDKRGFDVVVPIGPGTHTVTATAVKIGAGADKTFPAKTVTVPGKPSGRPGPHNTGVPDGVSLKRHDGDMTITEAGQIIDGMDIHGFVTIKASNVVIKNSRIRGGKAPVSHRSLVLVDSSQNSVTIQDSELAPSPEDAHWNIDGVRGMNITAERINIHNVIDQFHIYGDNVTIRDSWLHDNAHFTNDPNWHCKPSHDDNIQIQKGNNIRIENNHISGSHSAAIMVTQDLAQVVNLAIRDNFLDGGGCTVNFKHHTDRPAPSGVTIWNNEFGGKAKWEFCAIKNPDTSFKPDLKNNQFTNGEAVGITP